MSRVVHLRGKGTHLANIGNILVKRGKLAQALQHYQEALAINEQLGDLKGRAIIIGNIGVILREKGELEKAMKNYWEVLAIDEQLGNLRGKAIRLKTSEGS